MGMRRISTDCTSGTSRPRRGRPGRMADWDRKRSRLSDRLQNGSPTRMFSRRIASATPTVRSGRRDRCLRRPSAPARVGPDDFCAAHGRNHVRVTRDVPRMIEVLEIGTGCGYHAAVTTSWSAQRTSSAGDHATLADEARETLAATGYGSVSVRAGDGKQGWPASEPEMNVSVPCRAGFLRPARRADPRWWRPAGSDRRRPTATHPTENRLAARSKKRITAASGSSRCSRVFDRHGRCRAIDIAPAEYTNMDPAVLRDDMVDSLQHGSQGVVGARGCRQRCVPTERGVRRRARLLRPPEERFGTRVLSPSTAGRVLETLSPEEDDDGSWTVPASATRPPCGRTGRRSERSCDRYHAPPRHRSAPNWQKQATTPSSWTGVTALTRLPESHRTTAFSWKPPQSTHPERSSATNRRRPPRDAA